VIATVVICGALLLEYSNRMEAWLTLPTQPAQVYRWLAAQPRSVVVEVPFARADALHSISDGLYMFNSTWHWQPIVNGYSGFFPESFMAMSFVMETFPSDSSIAYLRSRHVDLLILHGSLLGPEKFGRMAADLAARPDIEMLAQFEERMGTDVVFRLRR
jgi:hypothetical protein